MMKTSEMFDSQPSTRYRFTPEVVLESPVPFAVTWARTRNHMTCFAQTQQQIRIF